MFIMVVSESKLARLLQCFLGDQATVISITDDIKDGHHKDDSPNAPHGETCLQSSDSPPLLGKRLNNHYEWISCMNGVHLYYLCVS